VLPALGRLHNANAAAQTQNSSHFVRLVDPSRRFLGPSLLTPGGEAAPTASPSAGPTALHPRKPRPRRPRSPRSSRGPVSRAQAIWQRQIHLLIWKARENDVRLGAAGTFDSGRLDDDAHPSRRRVHASTPEWAA
jgi:hypothetical protein